MSFVVMFVFNVPRGMKNKHLVFSTSFHRIFRHLIEAYKVQITHALFQNEITQFTAEHVSASQSCPHFLL